MSGTPHSPQARSLALLSVFAVLPWLLFHLWEQWAAFAGRAAWLERMHGTSGSVGMRVAEVLGGVLPVLALAVLGGRAIAAGGPLPGHAEHDDDGALVRFLGRASKPALALTAAFLLVHVGWLWAPRALGTTSLAEGYEALRVAAGTPFLLVVHAVGLCAVAVHVAASLPAWLVVSGIVESREGRRSAALLGAGLSACLLVLLVQLYGWHATGTGTVWPVRVIDVGDAAPETPPDTEP